MGKGPRQQCPGPGGLRRKEEGGGSHLGRQTGGPSQGALRRGWAPSEAMREPGRGTGDAAGGRRRDVAAPAAAVSQAWAAAARPAWRSGGSAGGGGGGGQTATRGAAEGRADRGAGAGPARRGVARR